MINKSCFLKGLFGYSSLIIYISLIIFVSIPISGLADHHDHHDDDGSLTRFTGVDGHGNGNVLTATTGVVSEASAETPNTNAGASSGAKSGKKGPGVFSLGCTLAQTIVLNKACNQKAYKDATKPVTDRFEQMMANNSNGSQKDQCQLVQQMNEATKKINQSITGNCHTAILSCETICGVALKKAYTARATATITVPIWIDKEIATIIKSMGTCASKWASVKKTSDLQIARNTDAIKQAKDCVDGLGGSGELSDSSNCNQLSLPQKNLCQELGEVAFCKQHPKIDFCHNVLDSLFAGKTDAPGPGHTNANAIASNPLKQTPTGGGAKV